MTRRLVGVFVAGAFAVGLASGAVGTIVAHDTTAPRDDVAALMADHMAGYGMGSMMSGSMMGGGPMVGPSSLAMPMNPTDHANHHGFATPEPSK